MRSWRPFCCGRPGRMRSMAIPKRSHHTDSRERLNRALGLAKGTPSRSKQHSERLLTRWRYRSRRDSSIRTTPFRLQIRGLDTQPSSTPTILQHDPFTVPLRWLTALNALKRPCPLAFSKASAKASISRPTAVSRGGMPSAARLAAARLSLNAPLWNLRQVPCVKIRVQIERVFRDHCDRVRKRAG